MTKRKTDSGENISQNKSIPHDILIYIGSFLNFLTQYDLQSFLTVNKQWCKCVIHWISYLEWFVISENYKWSNIKPIYNKIKSVYITCDWTAIIINRLSPNPKIVNLKIRGANISEIKLNELFPNLQYANFGLLCTNIKSSTVKCNTFTTNHKYNHIKTLIYNSNVSSDFRCFVELQVLYLENCGFVTFQFPETLQEIHFKNQKSFIRKNAVWNDIPICKWPTFRN